MTVPAGPSRRRCDVAAIGPVVGENGMKKVALGIAAVLALIGTPALAADMAVKAPPPASPSAWSWTGFYIGGNAGGAWGNFDPQSTTTFVGLLIAPDVSIFNAAGLSQSIKPSGFTGGFEAGYNWQFNSAVLGIEADIEALNLKGSSTVNSAFLGPIPFTISSSASTHWLETTRARLGFAAGSWLFYATGGAAFTTLKANFGFVDTIPESESASLSTTKAGYTVGGGVQAALWQKWSVKAEYLYVDFARVSIVAGWSDAPAQATVNSIDLRASIVRLGLDYRFN